jgi:hypothetical protein
MLELALAFTAPAARAPAPLRQHVFAADAAKA